MGNLFRKEAAESYKEQFTTNKAINKLSMPVVLLSFIFVVGTVLVFVWFFYGSVVSTVDIYGVVYPNDGVKEIKAADTGIVSQIAVSIGDYVDIGDIVAVLPNEEILNEIEGGAGDIEKLRRNYNASSVIRADVSGVVLDTAKRGDFIDKGEAIVSVVTERHDINQRQILAFLPLKNIKSIYEGNEVQISPEFAPREKYGYINAYVSSVGNDILTKTDIEKRYNYYNIPSLADDEQNYVAVNINLLLSDSGLDWSNKMGNEFDVEIGTLCKVSIVEKKQTPYKWLFGGGA